VVAIFSIKNVTSFSLCVLGDHFKKQVTNIDLFNIYVKLDTIELKLLLIETGKQYFCRTLYEV
jgi:hypothetical protein